MHNLVASPVFDPLMELEPMLRICSQIGFRKYEIMTSWVKAAFDLCKGTQHYLNLAQTYGITYTSLHLPPVQAENPTITLQRAIDYAVFAHQLDVGVVIFKAESQALYIQHARQFLDAVAALGLTTVITNHASTPISTLQDYQTVLDGVGDERLKALLEIGHFYKVGVDWEQAYDFLKGRVALVHIKEMQDDKPVAPYGTGEVAFADLFRRLQADGYTGDYVVELEKVPQEQAVSLLEQSVAYLRDMMATLPESEEH